MNRSYCQAETSLPLTFCIAEFKNRADMRTPHHKS